MNATIKWDDMVAEISRHVSLELHRPYADEGWSWAIYLGGAEVTSPPRKGLKRTRAMAQSECEEWYRRLVRGLGATEAGSVGGEEQRLARLAPEMLQLLRRAITHMSYPSDIRAEMIALVERADDAESEP